MLTAPLPGRLLAGGLVALVAAAAAFASLASYARRETVSGWLTPERGMIRVLARQGGLVEAVAVREGDQVAAGAPLATLKLSSDFAGGDVAGAIEAQMSAEGAAAEAQAVASRAKLRAQRIELTDRSARLDHELGEARDRVALLQQRQTLAEASAARGEALSRQGFLTRSNLDQLRAAALAAAQDSSAARTEVGALERQAADLRHDLAALPADQAALDAQAAQDRATLAQRRMTLQSQSASVARAPVSGRIVALPLQEGQVAAPGGTVAVLIPRGSQLTAELYAPSRAAGFIRPGQEVRLRYQAFPYQTFGTGRGVVRSISRTVLAPNEVAIPGLELREPVFRVRVALVRQSVSAYGRIMPLQPGMTLTADVVIDRRSLLQWVLDPLYAAGRRG